MADIVSWLGAALTSDDLRQVMSQQFRMEHIALKAGNYEEADGVETALNASDVCFNCGKPCHKLF